MTHHGPQNPAEVNKAIARRVIDGKAVALLMWHGLPGSGKSEAAILSAAEQQAILGSGPLQPKDLLVQLRFKPMDFPAMAQAAPKLKAVFCDEGSGEGGNKMRQMGTANVEVGIDLDACRGRQQSIHWCNPFRQDVSPQIQKHAYGAYEMTLDHHATFWEAEPLDPMFGKVPYFHERWSFPMPWLGDYLAQVREYYMWLKDEHMAGRNPFLTRLQEAKVERYRAAIARVLG